MNTTRRIPQKRADWWCPSCGHHVASVRKGGRTYLKGVRVYWPIRVFISHGRTSQFGVCPHPWHDRHRVESADTRRDKPRSGVDRSAMKTGPPNRKKANHMQRSKLALAALVWVAVSAPLPAGASTAGTCALSDWDGNVWSTSAPNREECIAADNGESVFAYWNPAPDPTSWSMEQCESTIRYNGQVCSVGLRRYNSDGSPDYYNEIVFTVTTSTYGTRAMNDPTDGTYTVPNTPGYYYSRSDGWTGPICIVLHMTAGPQRIQLYRPGATVPLARRGAFYENTTATAYAVTYPAPLLYGFRPATNASTVTEADCDDLDPGPPGVNDGYGDGVPDPLFPPVQHP